MRYIAPGILVSELLEVPSILVENFTWDWIYESLKNKDKGLKKVIPVFKEIYERASKRLQCIPVCEELDGHTKINPFIEPQTEVQMCFSKLSIGKGKSIF